MRDIELGRPVLGAAIMRILRLLVFADVDAVAHAAGGEMVHRVGQRLSVGIGREQREAFRKPPLEFCLQRIVVRDPEILENLNVAQQIQRTPARAARRSRCPES